MLTFLLGHIDAIIAIIGLIITYIGLILPIRKYLQEKWAQEKQLQFQNYHKVIWDLVWEQGVPKLDRQIAIAYELRNFPWYYDVSLRILKWLKDSWCKDSQWENQRLIEEISLTISYIKRHC